ncbi:MAG: type II secretion system F family protein [Rhizobiaceae bacterium]
MFGLDGTMLAFIGLTTLAVAGLIYAFMFDRVSNEVATEKRVKSVQNRDVVAKSNATARINDVAKRRKSVQDSLKELEDKQKEKQRKSIGIKKQMAQAGLNLSMNQFVLLSIFSSLFFGLVAFLAGAPLLGIGGAAFVGGVGVPRWLVSRIRKRRFNKFLEEFPNAVDVIVRGVRAGLPVNECFNIVATEAKPPISTEFSKIIEAQQMGLPMSEAVVKLYDNVPLAEANFFGIVISIQQAAGGNLSEALGNLSNVLRDRKKMKQKISAMSAEAKASAGIIGALPFLVAFLVYITTPDYIKILFTHPTGHIILVCSGLWMAMGIFVMKKMISFDF